MSLVSIILTTFNSERYVARSIASCLGQTYGNIELVIVDGGSQDRTLDVVASFNDSRICLVHQRDNAGKLPGAINVGMSEAKGDLLTWTQDDSWYSPEAISVMADSLEEHPEVALVYADYWDVDASGRLTRYQRVNEPDMILDEDVIRQCFLMRRSVYDTLGPQDTSYFPVHEPPWRIKVASQFGILPLHQPLMYYMVHEDSLTGRFGPWALQRMFPLVLVREGHITRAQSRRRLAKIHIDEAYENFILRGSYRNFWRCFLGGVLSDPSHLRNRGLLRMALLSMLPQRDVHRSKMLEQWQAEDYTRQASCLEVTSTDLRVGQFAPLPTTVSLKRVSGAE